MIDGALERQGASASRAFGFSKKYLKTQKLYRKNFCNLFFITRFSKNIFRKYFLCKIKNVIFENFEILKNFEIFENHIFLFFIKYFSKIFFENRVMKNKLQKCFRYNFCAFKYFLLNPKAREALAPCRSNAPSIIQTRQKLAK